MYALGGFITPYLMRHHDLDIAQANYVATIIYGLLSAPGLLLGGLIGDWAKRKRPDGALLIATLAILLSIPFYFFSIGIAAGEYITFAALIGTSVALMYFYYSIVYATIADVTEPASRGTAMAVYFLAMYLLGASLGPYIIGLISDYFTTSSGDRGRNHGIYGQNSRTVSRRRTSFGDVSRAGFKHAFDARFIRRFAHGEKRCREN